MERTFLSKVADVKTRSLDFTRETPTDDGFNEERDNGRDDDAPLPVAQPRLLRLSRRARCQSVAVGGQVSREP